MRIKAHGVFACARCNRVVVDDDCLRYAGGFLNTRQQSAMRVAPHCGVMAAAGWFVELKQ